VTLASESDTKTVDIPDLRNLKKNLEEPARTPVVNEPVTGLPTTLVVPAPPADGPPPKPPEPADTTRARGSFVPIAVGAGAVFLIGGALGLELSARSTYDSAKAEMRDQARRDSLYDSANHKRYAAEAFTVAGVACAGVAVWLYIRQRSSRAEVTSARTERLMLTPTASGIGIVGRF
jgi:hypothetical protein